MQSRHILHVDMDAFFASIEQRDNPDLRGKPVVVGGLPETRGVVAAASYEARRYGIKSAMPMATAVRLCTGLIIVSSHHGRYRSVSSQLMAIFSDYTPLVEPVSLDEAYLDVTGCTHLFGTLKDIAKKIQNRIAGELQLTASVGVGPNKLVAKLASDYRKPEGLTVISPQEVESFLANMPVEKVWGIGPRTCSELQKIGVTTVGKLQGISLDFLMQRFGKHGKVLYELSRGLDERPVITEQKAKTMGKEITFPKDIRDVPRVKNTLWELAEAVCHRMRKKGLVCASVTLKLKYADLSLITRTVTLPRPTALTVLVREAVLSLLKANWNGYPFVRLVGISCGKLMECGNVSPSLFPDEAMDKEEKITRVTDNLKEKFGEQVVTSAALLKEK